MSQKCDKKKRKKKWLKILGSATKPRLSIFRSNNHIYVQLINDNLGKTIICCSTLEKGLQSTLSTFSKLTKAQYIGKEIAQRSKQKDIKSAIFDNSFAYQGVVKALLEAARNTGLNC